jgi:hypothetical protein
MTRILVEKPKCQTCAHLRERTRKDKVHEAGYQDATHWCSELNSPTYPYLCRCGGDDYKVKLTPMMHQYNLLKARLPADTLLFIRLGDFYEAFFDDAEVISKAVKIALTNRYGVSMAGIPFHAVDYYVEKLRAAGYKVAVCEDYITNTFRVPL